MSAQRPSRAAFVWVAVGVAFGGFGVFVGFGPLASSATVGV
jgi:hypothetical protein